MAVYYDLAEYPTKSRGTAVALGFFDGVHLGHRAVIKGCEGMGLDTVALTFDKNPAGVLGRNDPPKLTDNLRKAELLSEIGADDIIFADFESIKDMSAEDFVTEILCKKLNARAVSCGYNYRFGKGGSGDTALLMRLCGKFGIKVNVIDAVTLNGEKISSSRIRELIAGGDTEKASHMLGYPYSIMGDISSGNHIGRMMGFPTVNIPIGEGMVVPRYGVYASKVMIDGVGYIGATNIGVHPTAGINDKPLCETFIIDFGGGDLYGKYAVCELYDHIRPEKRFSSLDELQEQISRDCEKIKDIMKGGV